jgi:hypothetical protein
VAKEEKEEAKTNGNEEGLQTEKETKEKAKTKEKTKTNHQTRANHQLGESHQAGKQIANLAMISSKESVKEVTNVNIGTNQHAKHSKKGTANMVTTASFPMQSQRLE